MNFNKHISPNEITKITHPIENINYQQQLNNKYT